MSTFSQRYGYKSSVLQLETASDTLKRRILAFVAPEGAVTLSFTVFHTLELYVVIPGGGVDAV